MCSGVTLDKHSPSKTPYLSARQTDQSKPATVARPCSQLKVGLAWAGNAGHHQDVHSLVIRLEELAPILKVPGVAFHSLQQPVA